MIESLRKQFDAYADDYLEFARISNPPSQRPDLCALLLLDRLVPDTRCFLINAAEHDRLYLALTPSDLARVAEPDDILYLVRCGVRYSSEFDRLYMYVSQRLREHSERNT